MPENKAECDNTSRRVAFQWITLVEAIPTSELWYGMAIGPNASGVLDDVPDAVDFSVLEQCNEYNDCRPRRVDAGDIYDFDAMPFPTSGLPQKRGSISRLPSFPRDHGNVSVNAVRCSILEPVVEELGDNKEHCRGPFSISRLEGRFAIGRRP